MENNWPETIDELLDECQRLISRYDLYTLGKRGKPFTGETEPRVDGTEYLAGEYQYGVAMIPAQWVEHVLSNAELGSGTCKNVSKYAKKCNHFECSKCGCVVEDFEGYYVSVHGKNWEHQLPWSFCPNCGKAVKR